MNLSRRFAGRTARIGSLALAMLFVPFLLPSVQAQYERVNLVSDQPGHAPNIDPQLINAWGIALFPGAPIWVSDNGAGVSKLYTNTGGAVPLIVPIPTASGTGTGSPTGIVANSDSNPADFVVGSGNTAGTAFFIFATLDGTISGWNGGATAIIGATKAGASYTGLAQVTDNNGFTFLYAADNANGHVDIFDSNFKFVNSFTDKNVPAGFAPYGIQGINGSVYVTFAGPGTTPGGVVDVFSTTGNLIRTFTSMGPLNQPWGLALAPADFGKFGNALLVGNNTPTGHISAFDFTTGKFLGQLSDGNDTITINQLWGLVFSAGPNNKTTLFFTAGTNNYADGLLGAITVDN
jgi:uncharacterized protein (TIGR03118 family)